MKKLSCNVAKDLMIPYLDDICSDESRELLCSHISECGECREFLGKISSEDRSTQAIQLKKIKKLGLVMKICSFMVFIVPFVLSVLIFFRIKNSFSDTGILPVQIFYFISMPVLMLCFRIAFSETEVLKRKKYIGVSWVSASALIFTIVCGVGLVLFPDRFSSGFIRAGFVSVLAAEVFSLVVYALTEEHKKSFLLQSISWSGIFSAMNLYSAVSYMSDSGTLKIRISAGFAILAAETLIVDFAIKAVSDKRK